VILTQRGNDQAETDSGRLVGFLRTT